MPRRSDACAERLEHRQRYRVSMSSNHSETENYFTSKMLTRKKKSPHTNMYCISGGLSAPFFPKSRKNKEIQPNAHFYTEDIKKSN